jgi:hypothetical protein
MPLRHSDRQSRTSAASPHLRVHTQPSLPVTRPPFACPARRERKPSSSRTHTFTSSRPRLCTTCTTFPLASCLSVVPCLKHPLAQYHPVSSVHQSSGVTLACSVAFARQTHSSREIWCCLLFLDPTGLITPSLLAHLHATGPLWIY